MSKVCSNCGEPCGSDSRMGSMDYYLVCDCNSEKIWIDEGSRGGYYVTKNNAHPVTPQEYLEKK